MLRLVHALRFLRKPATVWLFLLLAGNGCVSGRPTTAPATPIAAAIIASSPNAAETDVHCPLAPSQPHFAERLPRLYSDGKCRLRFLPAADPAGAEVILTYPPGWRVSLANPQGTALLFELAGRVFFIQVYPSDLPLERADEVGAAFGDFVDPAVRPEEIVKERLLTEVEGRPVLLLSTVFSEQSIRRYFLREGNGEKTPFIIMFQVTTAAPNLDNTMLLPIIEGMIGTAQLRSE